MLKLQQSLDFSYSDEIYAKIIPQDNIWRVLKDSTDFSSAVNSLSSTYSTDMGRPAKSPETLLKLLIIKEYYVLSDEDTIEECRVNLALRYFAGLTLDDDMPDKTTLGYFRRTRLKGSDAAEALLKSSVQAAVKAGILKVDDKGRKIINAAVDATHSEACCKRQFANDILPRRCRKLIDAVVESKLIGWDENIEVPDGMTSNEALHFAEGLLESLKNMFPHYKQTTSVARIANRMEEEINEFKDHAYTSYVDKDARVGYKSPTFRFFGYKTHIVCDVESGIVVAHATTPGNGSDTVQGVQLVSDLCDDPQMNVQSVLGDSAYSSQEMLELSQEKTFDLYATPNNTLGTCKAYEHGFSYVKDADALLCPGGNLSNKPFIRHNKRSNTTSRIFRFDKRICNKCSLKDTCYLTSKSRYDAEVPLITDLQKDLLERQKTPEFKEKFKARSTIERINGDIKRNQSMTKAQAPGLYNMTLQSTIALFTYNMRKIYNHLRKQAK